MIPHIVKGKGISGALAYVMGQGNDHETKRRKTLAEGEESRAQIVGGQNFGFEIDSKESLELARRGMEWNGLPQNQASRGIKCEKDCLHASLSWEKGQNPTAEEMDEAARGYLKALGMEKAQAVFVAHNDTAQKHLHIVASRIDPTTGKTFSQQDDFAKGLAWSMEFEKAQGIEQLSAGRQKLHKMADAIAARDVAALTGQLTETNPTFSARDLDKVLAYGGLSKEDRAGFKAEVLADKNVIGLRETAESRGYALHDPRSFGR